MICMRRTIRFNEVEELKLAMLAKYLNEEDMSKVVKFGVETALKHIEFVTEALVSKDWDVVFMRKRQSNPIARRVY